ncbi:unnamed protein product [Moneuplotes crassus]|uniref:Uncharacterized protein n=1 Tax=Euplotes crassus TaxID=5936 RepID=A0AAD1Y305_EUPCR|nr:unnamed protein product [Moneuplotes crassus]
MSKKPIHNINMNLMDLKSSTSLPTTFEGTHNGSSPARRGSPKHINAKPKSLKDRLRDRKRENTRNLNLLATCLEKSQIGLEEIRQAKKEILVQKQQDIDNAVASIHHSTENTLTRMMKQYEQASTKVVITNGIKEFDQTYLSLKLKEEEILAQAKCRKDYYQKHKFDKRDKEFKKKVKEIDEFHQSIQKMSNQMVQMIQQKDLATKMVRKDIKKRKRILKTLVENSAALENSRLNFKDMDLNYLQYSPNSPPASLKISKEVNNLMNERAGLLNIQKELKENIRYLAAQKQQINAEITYEDESLLNLEQKLNSFSKTFKKNLRLTESVDLDQSKLENFLSIEKDAKEELLCEVSQTKERIRKIRNSNPIDILDSLNTNESNSVTFEFAEEIIDQQESSETNTKLGGTNEDVYEEKYDEELRYKWRNPESNEIYVPKMARRPQRSPQAKNQPGTDDNEHDFSIGTMSQWQNNDFEEIPEVPEEASSANITPRRMEEEDEEILKLAEEGRNPSPLFEGKKSNEIFETRKCFFATSRLQTIPKFNIDREIELPQDAEMNISVLSSFEGSPEEDPNVLSACDLSFTSNNLQNMNTSENISKPPTKVPVLNLGKMKTASNIGHKPKLSLNLSAISVAQSASDTPKETIPNPAFFKESKRSRNNEHQRYSSKNTYATTLNSAKKEEGSLCDSFIKDANMIAEIFESQHTRKVSNLELTFEKSDDQEEGSKMDPLRLINLPTGKARFSVAHWNFGSRRLKH